MFDSWTLEDEVILFSDLIDEELFNQGNETEKLQGVYSSYDEYSSAIYEQF